MKKLREIAHRFDVFTKEHGIDGNLTLTITLSSVDDIRRLQSAVTDEFKDVIWNIPGWLPSEFKEFKLNGIKWKIELQSTDASE